MPIRLRYVAALLATSALAPAIAHAAEAAPEAAQPSQVSEVVVTAQRRNEKLVDVPVSVNTQSGERLEAAGVDRVQDLTQVVPGMHVDSSGSFVQPSIRGIGSALAGPGVASNVPTYVDGFYRPNALLANVDFVDVSSVQVLKGPQGTLFGRNATGGAILIATREPSLAAPHMTAEVSYGSYGDLQGRFYGSMPLSDTLAASVTLYGRHYDGFIKNDYTHQDAGNAQTDKEKLRLLWQPSDAVKLTLTFEHTKVDDDGSNALNPYNGWSTAALLGGDLTNSRGHVTDNAPLAHLAEESGVFLRGDFKLGELKLTSYTGYLSSTGLERIDMDATSTPILGANFSIREKTFSQEFDLSSPDKQFFSWVGGLYIFHDDSFFPAFHLSLFGGPYVLEWAAGQKSDSYAAFFDGTFNADRWHLTLGGRYSVDKGQVYFTPAGAPAQTTASKTWNSFTPRAVVRYELNDNSNIYLSVSRGTKAGIFNPSGLSTTPVSPEKLTAYELGYKYSGGGLQVEAAIFHYKYTDLQVAAYVNASAIISNAADSTINGAELHVVKAFDNGFRAELGGAYTDGKYDSYPNATVFGFNPALGGVYNTTGDVSGNSLQRTPKFTGNVALSYHHDLWGGQLTLAGNYAYQTRSYFDVNHLAYQDAYGLLNLRAGWTDPSERWTVAVEGRNVTDEKYLVQVLEQAAEFGQLWGTPATVTLSVGYRF